jgi:cysteine desulfurase/selenocysteine lyase
MTNAAEFFGMARKQLRSKGVMAAQTSVYDVDVIRRDFPLIAELARSNPPLSYLDNAASTQKPQAVLDAITNFYTRDYANIHRGVHILSQRATEGYEGAREKIRAFLNAKEAAECIFVRNATEGVNLVASCFVRKRLNKPGANIVITGMEHHADIVPWQLVMEGTGAELRVAPLDELGRLDEEAFLRLIDENTAIVGLSYVSNVLGTINPVERLIKEAHAKGAVVLLDAAQAAPHVAIDVQKLDCDFLVISGHKLYGPTGIGILYGKRAFLEAMPPYQGGGDMILTVSYAKTIYKGIPERFEAGTPHIAGAIGLGAAADYLLGLGMEKIAAHEVGLLRYAEERVSDIPGLRIIGRAPDKAAVLSFVVEGVHPHDIGTFLDADGIAIRAGHHCAEPLMKTLGIPGTARASFGLYNTTEEVDRLVASLHKIVKFFA